MSGIIYELFHSIKDPVLITNRDFEDPIIIFVNDAFTKEFGFTKQDVLGKTPRLLQGPKTDRKILDEIRKFLRDCHTGNLGNGQKLVVELINYDKRGNDYWNELTIINVNTETESMFLSISNLAVSKSRLELAFTSSEGDYNNPILFISWRVDSTWPILDISKSCKPLLGKEQIELLNTSFKNLVSPDDYKNLYRSVTSKLFWEHRIGLLVKSGTKRYFNANFYRFGVKVWGIFIEEKRLGDTLVNLIQALPGAFALITYSKTERGPIIKTSNAQFKQLLSIEKNTLPVKDLLGEALGIVAAKLFLNGVTQINQEITLKGMILDVLFSVIDSPDEQRLLIVRVRDGTAYKKALAEAETLKDKLKELQTTLDNTLDRSDGSKLSHVRDIVSSIEASDVESFYKSVYGQLERFSSGLDSISSQNSLMYKMISDNKRGLPGLNRRVEVVIKKKGLLEKTFDGALELIKEHPKLFIYGLLVLVGGAQAVSMSDLSGFLDSLERLLGGDLDD